MGDEDKDREKEKENFLRKPLLIRSPQSAKKIKDDIGNGDIVNKNMFRRNREETTLDDIFNLINEKSTEQLEEMNKIKSVFRNEMSSMKTEINNKIDLVEMKADQGLRMAIDNRKLCINMIKQSRLECCMDISGLKLQEGMDLKILVLNTIRSFNIKIDDADIRKVTLYEIKKPNISSSKILTVTFGDIDTKVRIMREKNKIKVNNGIFFNITLTPENGYFMRKAKYITKGTKVQPKFYDNAVVVKFDEKNTLIIQNEENLTDLKNAIDELSQHELPMEVQSTSPKVQQSSCPPSPTLKRFDPEIKNLYYKSFNSFRNKVTNINNFSVIF